MPNANPAMPEWTARLDALLTGRGAETTGDDLPGAQLIVLDAADTEVFRAALARHWRTDPDQPSLIWIRPIGAAITNPATGLPEFDPAVVRRRALDVTTVHHTPEGLRLALTSGQSALIQPAAGDELADLQGWDTWIATIPITLRRDLKELIIDS